MSSNAILAVFPLNGRHRARLRRHPVGVYSNDLGSDSNVDVCAQSRTEMLRNYEIPNQRVPNERVYRFACGATAWPRSRSAA